MGGGRVASLTGVGPAACSAAQFLTGPGTARDVLVAPPVRKELSASTFALSYALRAGFRLEGRLAYDKQIVDPAKFRRQVASAEDARS